MQTMRRTQIRRAPEDDHGQGWQMVYTGFVLILLCFFAMLTSFASFQESKITRFVRSFSNAVTVFDSGNSLEQDEGTSPTDASMVTREDRLARLFERVNTLGQSHGLDHIDLRQTARGVVMTLSEKMLFTSGSATLTQKAYPLLVKLSQLFKSVQVPIEIEGHSDDVPIQTLAFPSNWELSTARAVNVLRFMTEKQDVDPPTISAVGMSQYHPVVPNVSNANRSKNRRVEIIFKPL